MRQSFPVLWPHLFGLPNNAEESVRRVGFGLAGYFLWLGLVAPAALAQALDPSSVTKQLICDGPKACSGGYVNGHIYETMAGDEKIGVLVSLAVIGKYVRADIFILNDSQSNVDVLPSNFVLSEVTPKQKMLKYVDGDKLIRSAERQIAFGDAMTALGANMQRQQSTVTTSSTGTVSANGSDGTTATGIYSGRSTSTTSTPDYAAQARAAETIRARDEAFATTADFASRVMLRANTLLPSDSLHGYMFFERDKKEKLVMLSGILGDTIYQFPFLLAVQ
jgi:hypothetical protein